MLPTTQTHNPTRTNTNKSDNGAASHGYSWLMARVGLVGLVKATNLRRRASLEGPVHEVVVRQILRDGGCSDTLQTWIKTDLLIGVHNV